MPAYIFKNLTDHMMYVRGYTPLSYIARTAMYDPATARALIGPQSSGGFQSDEYALTFKVQSVTRDVFRSSNVSVSKKNSEDFNRWKARSIMLVIRIDDDRNTICVEG